MGGVEVAVCRRVKVSIEGPWVHRVLKLEGNLVADIGRNLAGGMAGVHIGDCPALSTCIDIWCGREKVPVWLRRPPLLAVAVPTRRARRRWGRGVVIVHIFVWSRKKQLMAWYMLYWRRNQFIGALEPRGL